MAQVLEEAVDTTEVEEVIAFWSVVTGVTVNTVDCFVKGATEASDGNNTDVEREDTVVTTEAIEILSGVIVLEFVDGVGLVTAIDIVVIVTFNGGCADELVTSNAVLRRLESNDTCCLVSETNDKNALPENGALNTRNAEPEVEKCGERIGISNREPALELDSWGCFVVM